VKLGAWFVLVAKIRMSGLLVSEMGRTPPAGLNGLKDRSMVRNVEGQDVKDLIRQCSKQDIDIIVKPLLIRHSAEHAGVMR
jgi:hypothetical protein